MQVLIDAKTTMPPEESCQSRLLMPILKLFQAIFYKKKNAWTMLITKTS